MEMILKGHGSSVCDATFRILWGFITFVENAGKMRAKD